MNLAPPAILTYHSLDDSGSVISTPPARFRQQMEDLVHAGIPVVPLNRIRQSPGSVAITFDDGFQNVYQHAVPLLARYGMPATIFVVSRYCGGSNEWAATDGGSAPLLPLLTWPQLREISPIAEVGAHTVSHPNLAALSPSQAETEVSGCKDDIEQHLGQTVRHFAYPYGSSSPTVRSLARRHFELALGTSLRLLAPQDDPQDLPRIDAYYLTAKFRVAALFTPRGRAYIRMRQLLRIARRQLTSFRGI